MDKPYETIDGHHINSPSRLDRRKLCPGSGKMEAQAGPEVGSPEASEGTMLHGRTVSRDFDGLDDEQADLVMQCLNVMDGIAGSGGEPEWVKQEYPMELDDEYGNVLTAGTPDVVTLYPDHVKIIDWKFGRAPVDQDSLQFVAYAALAMANLDRTEVEFTVFQPRVSREPITWEMEGRGVLLDRISEAIEGTKGPGLNLIPSKTACTNCKALSFCPAVEREALQLASADLAVIPPERAAEFYEKATIVGKRVSQIKDEIKRMALDGDVPGIWLKTEQGNRQAMDPMAAAEATGMSTADVLQVAKVSYKDLETLFAVFTKAKDGGMTKTEAQAMLPDKLGDLLVRGNPKVSVVVDKD